MPGNRSGALSAVVASGAAVSAVAEGFRSAKSTMQKILKKEETVADEMPEENVEEAEIIVCES